MKKLNLNQMEKVEAGQMSPEKCALLAIAIVAGGAAGILSGGLSWIAVGMMTTTFAFNCDPS